MEADLMHEQLLSRLNEQQRAAVEPQTGVILVRAGAGSGKTRVITYRIAHLMGAHGFSPAAILALTFTNKAAREMQERVNALCAAARPPYIGTFHAFCLRLLKINRTFLGLEDFSIFDESDQEKCMQKLISEHGVHKQVNPSSVLSIISHAKNRATTGIVNPLAIAQPIVRELLIAYEEEKKRSRCFDFDDLLLQAILLFKNPAFRTTYQQQIRHLLVDEYQDTNLVQHALLKLIATNERGEFALDSLCVVGDEDQSIYSWRGATVENILSFAQDFPRTTSVTIDQNYRSAQPILDVANSVISNNRRRVPKKLWSEKSGQNRVLLLQTQSDRHEGEAVAALTKVSRRHRRADSLAVLYRSHYQSRTIEESLIRASVPYIIIGGIKFYERQEIKDLLAYLRLLVNPYDRISFIRVFNTPTRGLGAQFEELFFTEWSNNPFLTFDGIARLLIDQQLVTGRKAEALGQFINLFSSLNSTELPSVTLIRLIQTINYGSYLRDSFDEAVAEEKTENIRELVSAAQAMEERGITTLGTFLDEVALIQEAGSKDQEGNEENPLVLMSIHAAKGLEFETVMLVGLEENVFPSSRSTIDDYLLEEERRLLYVGITRARERLLITHTQQRYTFGRICSQLPSRFLREIPATSAAPLDATNWSSYRFEQYFDGWITGTVTERRGSWTDSLSDPFAQPIRPARNTKLASNTGKKAPSNNARPAASNSWKPHQTVHHKLFGAGVIKKVEQQPSDSTSITVLFSDGIKKIDSSFLEAG